ncbi:MAG: DUF364 domain-containing protein [Clostridia bacterium]|jgi:uncharacterized protein (DUF4213/DUF364 family)|nr:DUF364 domain-containing protein [Clostridia bacterium]MDH7572971.1 DUF364 domain-containing protein [Clostridia bacterium]
MQELIDFFAARPEAATRVSQIVVNTGFTGVLLENGQAGMAMNIRSAGRPAQADLDFLQEVIGRPALDLASRSLGYGRLALSAGVAALSALSQPYLDQSFLGPHNLKVDRVDTGRFPDHGITPGSRVGMVGFGGGAWRMAGLAGQLVVTELEPELFRSRIISREGVVEGPTRFRLAPAAESPYLLAGCDTVLITGCALVSRTIDELLATCRNSRVVIYGPSASLLPLPFFRHPQVAAITTIRVLDGTKLMNLLANAGPGVERLLAEASESLYIRRLEPAGTITPADSPSGVTACGNAETGASESITPSA